MNPAPPVTSNFIAYAEPDLRLNIFGVLPEDWPPETLEPLLELLFRLTLDFFFFSKASRNLAFDWLLVGSDTSIFPSVDSISIKPEFQFGDIFYGHRVCE